MRFDSERMVIQMKVLVAVFSAEGKTGRIAGQAAAHMGWDFYEIQPVKPYTKADIKWTNPLARCNREKFGRKEVPVQGSIANFDQYDAVLIGFPIWYGGAPNVVNSFCSGYDFTGKKVALFATSGGSGIGKTKEKLQPYVKGTEIIDAVLVSDGDDLVSFAEKVLGAMGR